MSGTYIVRTTFMTNATGATTLVSVPPVIGCSLLGPAVGGVSIPIAADGYIYLDGSLTATNLADLPVGFTPANAFSLDHYTVISTAGDQAIYSLPLGPTQTATITALNPGGGWLQRPMTGMTSLTVLAGSSITVAMTAVAAGLVVIQNLSNTGQWDTGNPPTYGVGLSGAYTIVAPPTIVGISPSTGPVAGGTLVTITGTGLTGTTSVTVGGASVVFTLVSDSTITFVTPAHAAGAVTIVLVGLGLSTTFTYALLGQFSKLPPLPKLR